MQSVAQKKARINGWIKEYEKRIEQHKVNYGETSRLGYLHIMLCKNKIKSWKQKLKTLTKEKQINKVQVCKFVYEKSCEYFGVRIYFDKEGSAGSIDKKPERYYVSKFLVDSGLTDQYSCHAIGGYIRSFYPRRNELTKRKDHKNSYRAYKLTMESELQANNIQYK